MAGKIVDVTLRLIDKISTPLNAVGTKLSQSARNYVRAGKQIEKAGKNIAKVGQSMTKSLTLPIIATGTACIKMASDFEAGMSRVQSISGATAEQIARLSEKAKQMGAQTKFSATEASEAFSYMAMAGWKTEEMLEGIEGIMYLAGATGEDLATTSDIVTDALTAFGLSASDTNKFVNVLAQTSANANTNVAMLGESFQYVAPVAGALGYSVEDVSTALGVMANSGIKASNAGTALRTLFSNLAKPTDQMKKAMDNLGISLTDSEGNMKDFNSLMLDMRAGFADLDEAQKASYASTIAGKLGMSGLLAIVNTSDSDFNKLSESIYNSAGACEEMYKVANDNLKGQLTILKSTVQSLAISFGERLTPYVEKAVKWLQNLTDKFNSLSDKQKDFIVKIALVVATIGPAILLFGKLTMAIGKTIKTIGMIGNAFKTFGSIAGLLSNPVGLVILAIIAVVTAGVLLVKNWDKIKETAIRVWGTIKDFVSKIVESIKEKFGSIIEKCKEIIEKVKNMFGGVGDFFKKIFSGDFKGAFSGSLSVEQQKMPQLAVGTNNWRGGFAQISERGGEIVDLPRGSRVYPHDESVNKAYTDGQRAGGAGTITIAKLADQIIVREEADIDKIAQRLADKLEKVSQNIGGGKIGYIY